MPLYEFRCPHGHVTTLVRSMSDEIPTEIRCLGGDERDRAIAEDCGAQGERIYSLGAIHFKGPGFYATDVQGRLNRKRRKGGAADLMPPIHDPSAEAIARRL